MSTIVPDVWAVIEFGHDDEVGTSRKILAGWHGSLDSGSNWKLSTEIRKTDEQKDRFVFVTNSGNKCVCYRDREGVSSFSASLLEGFRQDLKEGGWLQVVEYNQQEESNKPDGFKMIKYVKEKPPADPSANTEPQPTFTEKLKEVFSFLKK
jgi:hypothetical protein